MVCEQAAGEGCQPASVGNEKKGAVRELVNAGGSRQGGRVARLRLDEHGGLAIDEAVSVASERDNSRDDDKVEPTIIKHGT